MTQTPKQPIYKYTAIPTDEHFNPDRPSLELACRGNRTMGNILNFLVSRASYIAEKGKLESCKVVTINIARDEILKAIRISEKTYITYLKELNELHYVDTKRYARREYDVNFEAINEGIKNPPAQKLRGRPKGSKRQCKSGSNKPEENTSTLQNNTSTYVLELENKVEVLSEKLKELQLKVESITTFEKELQLFRKVLQLSESNESIPQALREAFSKPLDVLDVNEITNKDTYVNADALTHTHSSENENYYPQSNTSSPQDIHSEPQASKDIPIATTKGDTTHGRDNKHMVGTTSYPHVPDIASHRDAPDVLDDEKHVERPSGHPERIETTQVALVGVATRNTESLVEPPQAAAPTKQRSSRKPKVKTPEDEGMKKRIDAVLDCLDELGTEYAGEEFHYSRFKTDKEAVETLLTSWTKLTREQVRDTYRSMMDSPRSQNGFLWSEHMSVKAFCNNFATEFAKTKTKGHSNGHEPKKDTPQEIPEGYVMWKGQVMKREDIETDFDKYVGNGKEERARLHQAALNDPEVAAIIADMERAG